MVHWFPPPTEKTQHYRTLTSSPQDPTKFPARKVDVKNEDRDVSFVALVSKWRPDRHPQLVTKLSMIVPCATISGNFGTIAMIFACDTMELRLILCS